MTMIYKWFLVSGFRERVKMWHYLVTNSNTFWSSANEVRPSVRWAILPLFRPSVHLSVCPSVRPTCECDILRTVSPIDFKFEIWYQITRITDAIDFGPSAKNKMAAIEIFEPFHQSTSNLKFVFIMSRGRTLLILAHLLKTRWPPLKFLKCMWTQYLYNGFTNRLQVWSMKSYHLKDRLYWFWAICYNQDGRHWTLKINACKRDIFKTVSQIDCKLDICFHNI